MKKLISPTHSLEPTDWRMYCDLLQDAGEPEHRWRRAQNIANSLALDTRLVLINYCPARWLNNHWLRVGRTWFIGASGTFIEGNRLVWWRKSWVEAGFGRYPSPDPDRDGPALIAMNYGYPWELPHTRFEILQAAKIYRRLRPAYWDAHALPDIPERYL